MNRGNQLTKSGERKKIVICRVECSLFIAELQFGSNRTAERPAGRGKITCTPALKNIRNSVIKVYSRKFMATVSTNYTLPFRLVDVETRVHRVARTAAAAEPSRIVAVAVGRCHFSLNFLAAFPEVERRMSAQHNQIIYCRFLFHFYFSFLSAIFTPSDRSSRSPVSFFILDNVRRTCLISAALSPLRWHCSS